MAAGTDLSRRDFIGSLAAAAVLPSAVAGQDNWFQDIEPGRDYVLHWRYPKVDPSMYREERMSCAEMRSLLMFHLQYGLSRPGADEWLDDFASTGYFITSEQPTPVRFQLTQRWLREFYRRHREEVAA